MGCAGVCCCVGVWAGCGEARAPDGVVEEAGWGVGVGVEAGAGAVAGVAVAAAAAAMWLL
jgi:hypothetical protein